MSSFSDYLRGAGEDVSFETVPTDDLVKHLRQSYAGLRRQERRQYNKSSYINIRSAINFHLQSPPHSRQINIAHDRSIMSSNHVFVGLLKDSKARGLDQTTHKTAISCFMQVVSSVRTTLGLCSARFSLNWCCILGAGAGRGCETCARTPSWSKWMHQANHMLLWPTTNLARTTRTCLLTRPMMKNSQWWWSSHSVVR